MYSRLLKPPEGKSFFLFGPRATGKTTWAQAHFPEAIRIDLLESRLFDSLLADPQRLADLIPVGHRGPVVVDEIQKIPALLDEVHRLIEKRRIVFVLTGSSARKLRRGGVNLLAGRALTCAMHPLAAAEIGSRFDLEHALAHGLLPSVQTEKDPARYLASYVKTYLEEEIRQGGLTRNLSAFARFQEAASFSQGSVLNISGVARESSVERKAVENYFDILDDLLIAHRIPVFSKRAKRRLTVHPKFYFFDAGVFQTIRPRGPLDTPEEAAGPALETLVLQNLIAVNDAMQLGYTIYYWRTAEGTEVDFILYGPRGLFAIEVKRGSRLPSAALTGLRSFLKDFPSAKPMLIYGGPRRLSLGSIDVRPVRDFLLNLPDIIGDRGR